MKSWSNWVELNHQNIWSIPSNIKGVYVIRKTKNIKKNESDIIYIGCSGKSLKHVGIQGVGGRLRKLWRGRNYSASDCIMRHIDEGLEFSWFKCFQAPDGVEKALLLGFYISTGNLPICNRCF